MQTLDLQHVSDSQFCSLYIHYYSLSTLIWMDRIKRDGVGGAGAGAGAGVGVGDAGVAVEVVAEHPAPVGVAVHRHLGPPVDPHVVLPHLAVRQQPRHDRVRRLVPAPHLVVRLRRDAAVRVEVPPHRGSGPSPVRVQLTPVLRCRLHTHTHTHTFFR